MKYKLKKVQGLPVDTKFVADGVVGDWIAYVLEFEPLPDNVESIAYSQPELEIKDWNDRWKAEYIPGLKIKDLENNQTLFKYNERKVVE